MLSSDLPDEQRPRPAGGASRPRESAATGGSNVRRLEAEAIRDALLAVSGTLDRDAGRARCCTSRTATTSSTTRRRTRPSYDSPRRSLYLPVVRNNLYDVFQLFDFPDAAVANGDRATTTVAPQALFLLNSDLVDQAAERPGRAAARARRPRRRRPGRAGSTRRPTAARRRPRRSAAAAAVPRRGSSAALRPRSRTRRTAPPRLAGAAARSVAGGERVRLRR